MDSGMPGIVVKFTLATKSVTSVGISATLQPLTSILEQYKLILDNYWIMKTNKHNLHSKIRYRS